VGLKNVTDSISNTLYRQVGRASSQVQKNRSLPVDILENETSYLVIFDAPGAEKEDIQVRYLGGTVKVRIDRFRAYHEGFEMRFPGRSMAIDGEAELPDDAVVSPDAATARLTDTGTLNIEIPKHGSLESDSVSQAQAQAQAQTDAKADTPDDGIAVDE